MSAKRKAAALAAAGVDGVLHATGSFRLLHNHLLPGTVTMLMYHGLLDTPLSVPDPCFLPVDVFAAQMAYLARHFDVVPADAATTPPVSPSARPRACITFDDGFESVLTRALPVLERLSLPATVYLVTDLIDTDTPLWFTRLNEAFAQSSALAVKFQSHVYPLNGAAVRAQSCAALQMALKRLHKLEFEAALTDVLHQLGAPRHPGFPSGHPFRLLTSSQIRAAGRSGLMQFGAHTVSHQILTRTEPADAASEIARSVAAVAGLVDRPSSSFAYPNGGPDDFDANAIAAVARAGVACALTTIPGPVTTKSDRFALPRYNIADVPVARFARQIHHARAALSRAAGSRA